jgi:hypothetical protein
MRFISTRMHGMEDYVVGILLLLAPNLFGFADVAAAAMTARVVGVAILGMALLTRYELGMAKVIPMSMHLTMDVLTGLLLAASPWLFGFADAGSQAWMPHVVIGLMVVLSSLMTETHPRFETGTPQGRVGHHARA